MTDNITLVLSCIGMLLFGLGAMNIIRNYENGKPGLIIAIIGVVFMIVALIFSGHTQQKGEASLKENIATKINVDSEEIIIEDMGEDEVFRQSKNTNLRKVYADNKTYIVEVKDYKVEKIVEQ